MKSKKNAWSKSKKQSKFLKIFGNTRRKRAIVFVLAFAVVGSIVAYFAFAGTLTNDDQNIFNYTNNYRQQNGLAPLALSGCLTSEARQWAQHMAAEQWLHHPDPINNHDSSDNGLIANTITPTGPCSDQWQWLGQNVGEGNTSDAIFAAFKASPEHNANLLRSNYNMIGVATYRDDRNELWVVQTFAQCNNCDTTWTSLPSAAPSSGSSVQSGVVGVAQKADGTGFWTTDAYGRVAGYDHATFYGDLAGRALNKPIVGMAAKPDGTGYWLVASDGGIFAFGNAPFYGSTGSLTLAAPIVAMAATPSGGGYWLVARDGGIFAFGNAPFYGSMGGKTLTKPIIGMAVTPSGGGYWLVGSDGGIYAFGNAPFYGSTGSMALAKPIVGMAAAPNGAGYWLVASDGGVFTFGNIGFYGSAASLNLPNPVVGIIAAPDSLGYSIIQSDNTPLYYGSSYKVLDDVQVYVNTPPTVPGGVHVISTTTSAANIAWSASTDNRGVQGYKVYRNNTYIATTANTSYTDSNLHSSTSYSYQVSAIDYEGGESAKSPAVSAMTQNVPPTIPQNLHMTSRSISSISLAWNASTDDTGVKEYWVYRNNVKIGTTPSVSFVDSILNKGTTYTYQVQAVDLVGAPSGFSSSLSATTCSNKACTR